MREELAFVRAILDDPDDDTPRLMYADWLEECGDPRGEYLRVAVALERLREQTPADDQRTRLRHAREIGRLTAQLKVLQPRIPLEWLAKLHRGRIWSCAGLIEEDGDELRCPLDWQRLQETDNPSVRRCGVCSRLVRLCRSAREAEQFLAQGRVVVKMLVVER